MAEEQFDDELTLALRKPIKLGDLEYFELQLEEPTGAMLQLAAKEDAMGGLFLLIAHTAKVSPAVPKQMRQRDLQRAADFFAHFGDLPSSTPSTSTPQS